MNRKKQKRKNKNKIRKKQKQKRTVKSEGKRGTGEYEKQEIFVSEITN